MRVSCTCAWVAPRSAAGRGERRQVQIHGQRAEGGELQQDGEDGGRAAVTNSGAVVVMAYRSVDRRDNLSNSMLWPQRSDTEMDLRQLQLVVAVADDQFTRAAARCHVVQSAIRGGAITSTGSALLTGRRGTARRPG